MLAEQRQDPPLDPLVEEVRVAMALNGGMALAVALGLPVALPIPAIRKRVDALLARPWGGAVSLVLTLGPWLVIGAFSFVVLVGELSPFDAFRTTSAALALVAAPLLGLGYIAASGRLRHHAA
jgi:4-amino-4-deoxy-L-arabinose transferase-like glycosyltransferase